MKKEKPFFYILALSLTGWLVAAAVFIIGMKYKDDASRLKQLVAIYESRKNAYINGVTDEMLKSRQERGKNDSRIFDFLAWKSILQEGITLTNSKFMRSVKALQDLKSKKELGGLLYYTLGISYTTAADFASAKEAFGDALRFNPDDAEANYMLGFLYGLNSDRKDINKAISCYNRFIELSPPGEKVEQARQKIEELKRKIKP